MLGYIGTIPVPGSGGEDPGAGLTGVGLTFESAVMTGTWVCVDRPGSWVHRGQPNTKNNCSRLSVLVPGCKFGIGLVREPGFTVAGLEAGPAENLGPQDLVWTLNLMKPVWNLGRMKAWVRCNQLDA